jgi:hypothetical protein
MVDLTGPDAAQREELSRLSRVTMYLRVIFSIIMLAFASFGPGILLRFPFAGPGVTLGPMSQFYAFRPVIFALLLAALSCVLGALARRAVELFRVLCTDTPQPGRRYLRPAAFPFVLSGSTVIDTLVFIVVLAAYSFWVVVLVETTPVVLVGYQTTGIVMGSYGLFATAIVMGYSWRDTLRRIRAAT